MAKRGKQSATGRNSWILTLLALILVGGSYFFGGYDALDAGLKQLERLQSGQQTSGTEANGMSVPPAQKTTGGKSKESQKNKGVRIVSWNLLNFGKSKDDQEVTYMASQLRDFDIVAVQEVVTSPAGAQAIARLADALSRTGSQWDYAISDPTTGPGPERYAFLWKPSAAKLIGKAWLYKELDEEIDREPYLARYELKGGQKVLLVSFHAVPSNKQPQKEIEKLHHIHEAYPDDTILIMGDFNLSQRHPSFNQLKAYEYLPAIVGQRTSLKMEVGKDGQHLANEYDNIFYEHLELRVESTGVIDFSKDFPTLRDARKISDHIPVWIHLN